jgi:hypothetical protein
MIKHRKNKWQRKFIKTIFDCCQDHKKNFSKTVLKNIDLVNTKSKYMPNYLLKYYAPTSDNILDIKNKRLWLSHPNTFNDPFDCNVGYDRESFEKNVLLDFIKNIGIVNETEKTEGFTVEEKNLIANSPIEDGYSWYTRREVYWDVKRKMLENKSHDFQVKVDKHLELKLKDLDFKIEKIKNINIRVACFSQLEIYDEFKSQIAMWSHYADDHRGFCVEFDLSFLKEETKFTYDFMDFWDKKNEYLDERNKFIIKSSLFPVEYTASRINIPVTKLKRIKTNEQGEIDYNTNIDELIYKTYIVKSANWNYEKEWRIILDEEICRFYSNKIPFPYIKTIYLGCKAKKELIDTMYDISKEIGAEIRLLRMDGQRFILEDLGISGYEFERDRFSYHNPFFS